MKSNGLWVAVAAAGAITAHSNAEAQAAGSGLAEVSVTASRIEETLPQELSHYGNHVEYINNATITNGAYLDITQTLNAVVPGLYVQAKNGPFDYADISLLGSRTDDVLWLVDGVRINNRLYSGTAPLDTVPAGIVDRIEVLEGGEALFYGTAAVAGAVNIITRAFTTEPAGQVNLGYDTNNNKHIDGYFSDAFGRQQLVLYASSDKSDGFKAFRDQDYQPSATDRDRGFDVLTGGAKYAFNFSDDLRLSASFQHTHADLDYAVPMRVSRDVNTRDEDLATIKLDYALSDTVGFFVKSYYHRWHTNYDTDYNDLQNPGQTIVLYHDAIWGYDDKGINALAKISFKPGLEYYVGYDYQAYGGHDEVLFIEPSKEHTGAVFAQVRIGPEILANTHLAAGFRYNDPSVGDNATVWNLSGQYDITPGLFVRSTLGTNFRLPTAEELFANDPQDERGNPDLKPEHTKSINLSIGGVVTDNDAGFRWELTGFARDTTNLIAYDDFDDVTGQSVFGNVAGTVRVRGGQLALSADLNATTSAALSFTRSKSRADDGELLVRVPESLLRGSVDYHPAGLPFGASLIANYTGTTYTAVGGDPVQYGRYLVVNASARYFFDEAHKHQFNLSLDNVFDKEYGRPIRACQDVSTDGPYDCSAPYQAVNLGLPRTLRANFIYRF